MNNYDLFAHTDQHVTRLKFQPETDNSHFWPSEASVKYFDRYGDRVTEGKCLRASFFRVQGGFEKIGTSAYSEWIFKMGHVVEKMLIEEWKEMGVWVQNNIKFYDREYNISGEIDVLLAEPPDATIYISEIKTAYGYFAEKEIFGNKYQKGFPKIGQLLQLLVYLWKFRDQFPYGRLVYFFRDNTRRKAFKVSLLQEGDIFYPVIDGEVVRFFTVNDVLDRYKELAEYVNSNTIPPADYELQYPDAKIEDFYRKGKVSKTKYEAWSKGKLKPWEYVGDWNCAWCPWRKNCYPNINDAPAKDHL